MTMEYYGFMDQQPDEIVQSDGGFFSQWCLVSNTQIDHVQQFLGRPVSKQTDMI